MFRRERRPVSLDRKSETTYSRFIKSKENQNEKKQYPQTGIGGCVYSSRCGWKPVFLPCIRQQMCSCTAYREHPLRRVPGPRMGRGRGLRSQPSEKSAGPRQPHGLPWQHDRRAALRSRLQGHEGQVRRPARDAACGDLRHRRAGRPLRLPHRHPVHERGRGRRGLLCIYRRCSPEAPSAKCRRGWTPDA